MKLLDRYILRQFFLACFVALLGFIIIYVAVDMMEKLDKFLDKKVPALIVVEYYINFTPQIISLILPVALLLGSLFAAGKMSGNSEIIAMRSAGMSLYRYMGPFVVAALLISIGAIYFNGWVLPKANARVLEIQRRYVQENLVSSSQFNLHMQESPTTIVTMQDFSLDILRANRVSVQYFADSTRMHMVRRIDADMMQWDSTKRVWRLTGAIERTFTSRSTSAPGIQSDSTKTTKSNAAPSKTAIPQSTPTSKETLAAKDTATLDTTGEIMRVLKGDETLLHFTFTPAELRERQLRYEEMTNPQLKRRIDLAKRAGQETARDEVDYYAKYAMAFTSLIVVLFGVPFAARKKRGGLSFEFSVAIFISFIFLAFTKVSQTFGYSGQIHPIITAWIANALFLLVALVVIAKAQK